MATNNIQAPANGQPAAEAADPRRWAALVVLILANFMTTADILIVNIGIPTIKVSLGATLAQIQFVLAIYQIAYAVGLITGGRLGDIFGRKRMFVLGLLAFTIASAMCGYAQTPDTLIISRLFQGLSSALMIPQVLATIQLSFPVKERPKVFSIYGASMGLAGSFGLLMGGTLINLNLFELGWRPIFLINVPIGLLAAIGSLFWVKESKAPEAKKLDLVGSILLTVGLYLMIYPLVEGRDLGWPSWTIPCLVGSAVGLVIFAVHQRWLESKGGTPLLRLKLFQDRSFVMGLVIALGFYAFFFSFFFVVGLFLQMGLQLDVMPAALWFTSLGVGFFVGAIMNAKIAGRVGPRNALMIGTVLFGVPLALMAWVMAMPDSPSLTVYLATLLVICGFGEGVVYGPLVNTLLATIQPADAGAASGVYNTVRQIASAVGVAVAGIILFGQLTSHADVVSAGVADTMRQECLAAGLPSRNVQMVVDGFQAGFHKLEEANPAGSLHAPQLPAAVISGPNGAKIAQKVAAAVAEARGTALRRNFAHAFQVTLYAYLVIVVVMLVLLRRLSLPTAQAAPKAPEAPKVEAMKVVPAATPEAMADDALEPMDVPEELSHHVAVAEDDAPPAFAVRTHSTKAFEGMVFCTCGSPLVLQQDPHDRYVCPQAVSSGGRLCQMTSAPGPVMDKAIGYLLRKGLGSRLQADLASAESQAAPFKAELGKLKAKRERILENYEDGLYGDSAEARITRNAKLTEVEKRSGELAQQMGSHSQKLDDLKQDLAACETLWKELTIERKRQIVDRWVPLGCTVRKDLVVKAVVCGKLIGVRPQPKRLPVHDLAADEATRA